MGGIFGQLYFGGVFLVGGFGFYMLFLLMLLLLWVHLLISVIAVNMFVVKANYGDGSCKIKRVRSAEYCDHHAARDHGYAHDTDDGAEHDAL